MDRSSRVIRTSFISIGANAVLVALKMVIGAATGSIAVILDAVNNLSDALSSVITVIGTRLSDRKPDRKHPYGYGRIEYLASVLVSALVMTAGFTSLRESVTSILHPEPASYDAVSILLIAVGVSVKVGVGRYVKRTGQAIDAPPCSTWSSPSAPMPTPFVRTCSPPLQRLTRRSPSRSISMRISAIDLIFASGI